jgi:hypothetical protein
MTLEEPDLSVVGVLQNTLQTRINNKLPLIGKKFYFKMIMIVMSTTIMITIVIIIIIIMTLLIITKF